MELFSFPAKRKCRMRNCKLRSSVGLTCSQCSLMFSVLSSSQDKATTPLYVKGAMQWNSCPTLIEPCKELPTRQCRLSHEGAPKPFLWSFMRTLLTASSTCLFSTPVLCSPLSVQQLPYETSPLMPHSSCSTTRTTQMFSFPWIGFLKWSLGSCAGQPELEPWVLRYIHTHLIREFKSEHPVH